MTYSTNFGNPAIEATNWNSLQTILEQLPDNTAQLISPKDVRDAIYTTWEQGTFKVVSVGGENYIGTENGGTVSNFRYKMLFGKKELQSGNTILDSDLLDYSINDTDIFIYNNKSDSNLSLQDTKMSFLAGDDFTTFDNAPYIEATKTTGTLSNWIDLNITNPATNGIIELNAQTLELGDSGWVIDNTTGDFYPVNDGQNIGLTGTGNRVGTIFMASRVDYLNELEFQSGTASPIKFDTTGKIVANSVEVTEELRFQVTATAGYFLSTDGSGNVLWGPGRINTVGVTAGYMSLADGVEDVYWIKPYADSTGVTAGYILTSSGVAQPNYKSIDNLDSNGATAGFVLGSDGSKTVWVSNVTGADGSNGEVQFNNSGFLGADSNFIWDNSNKRLGIGTTPIFDLDVNGMINSISGSFSNFQTTTSTLTTADIGTVNISGGYGTFSNFALTTGATAGYFLMTDTNGIGSWQEIPPTDPGGTQGSIQFNGTGSFSGNTDLLWDVDNREMLIQGAISNNIDGVTASTKIDTSFITSGEYSIFERKHGPIFSGADFHRMRIHYNTHLGSLSTNDPIGLLQWTVGNNADPQSDDIYCEIMGTTDASDATAGELRFRTTSTPTSSSPPDRLVIDKDGNVGIGNSSPSYRLDLGSSTIGSIRHGGSFITHTRILQQCAPAGFTMSIGTSYDHYLIFDTYTGSPPSCLPGQSLTMPDSYQLQPSQESNGRIINIYNRSGSSKDLISTSSNIRRGTSAPTQAITLTNGTSITVVYNSANAGWNVWE